MTDVFDRAIARTRALPPEMQDELARMLLLYAGEPEPAIQLTAEAGADRGEFTTDEDVRTLFARHRS